jgi:hypothetical protein
MNLSNLKLAKNHIGDSRATALSKGNFINLTELELENNAIGDDGATSLFYANLIHHT